VYVLAGVGVIAKRSIAADELHVALLARTEVMTNAVVVPVIVVTERLALFPGYDDHKRHFPRREDSALPLKLGRTAPHMVKLSAAIDAARLEHRFSL
jgi:hypothetical protein